jgi:hypothetical protein
MAGFFVGFVVGGAVVGLAVIVIAPSRRVRSETGIDDEIETRILLGVDPEPHAAPVVDIAHPRDYEHDEIKALEELGKAPKKRKAR